MNSAPAISVVMSVYNGEGYLSLAIKSVLSQTFTNFEFIIINDGSIDNSLTIIESFIDPRINLINQSNSGLSVALNNGIRASKGRYIARMDADDISNPERLQRQFVFLESNPEVVLVGSNAKIIDMYGSYVYSSNVPTDWKVIQSNFPDSSFFHSSVMFRKTVFDQTDGYFEPTSKIYSFEDSILWNKMKKFGRMENLKDELLSYRLVPNAATTKSSKVNKIITAIFYDIIKEGKLSKANENLLIKIKNTTTKEEKLYGYYFHLVKKYTWNNLQRKKIISNIINAVKIKPFRIQNYIYMAILIMPKPVIRSLRKAK